MRTKSASVAIPDNVVTQIIQTVVALNYCFFQLPTIPHKAIKYNNGGMDRMDGIDQAAKW